MSIQLRVNFKSEAQKREFRRACELAGTTMSNAVRGLADDMIAEYCGEQSPEAIERRAIELEQDAEEFFETAKDLQTERSTKLSEAEQARREAEELRARASELRATDSRYNDDLNELCSYLLENDLKVFLKHKKVQDIARDHNKDAEQVLDDLVSAGLSTDLVKGGTL